MNPYRNLVSNTALFGISTFGARFLTFLLTPFYTRVLSSTEYGITDLLLQTGNLILPIAAVGITNAVIRYGLEETCDKNGVFTTGLLVTLAGFCLLMLVSPLLGQLEFLSGYLWLVLLYVLAANVHSVCNQFARTLGYVRLFALDGRNTVEMLMANMDYARVSGCVITQEYIDGNQDAYLLACREKYPERMKICCLYEEKPIEDEWLSKFDGVKICGGRLENQDLLAHEEIFRQAERLGKFISIDMADGDAQTDAMERLIEKYPDLRIAVGHFGMVTVEGWEKQIALAKHKNVYIESGGITWLFNSEFYPYPSAVRAIRTAIDICGIDKLMWGSDYPRTMTAITYDMSKDFIEKTTKLSEEEKRKFLGENAEKFYGFSKLDIPEKIINMVE